MEIAPLEAEPQVERQHAAETDSDDYSDVSSHGMPIAALQYRDDLRSIVDANTASIEETSSEYSPGSDLSDRRSSNSCPSGTGSGSSSGFDSDQSAQTSERSARKH